MSPWFSKALKWSSNFSLFSSKFLFKRGDWIKVKDFDKDEYEKGQKKMDEQYKDIRQIMDGLAEKYEEERPVIFLLLSTSTGSSSHLLPEHMMVDQMPEHHQGHYRGLFLKMISIVELFKQSIINSEMAYRYKKYQKLEKERKDGKWVIPEKIYKWILIGW